MTLLLNGLLVLLLGLYIHSRMVLRELETRLKFMVGYVLFLHSKYKIKNETVFEFCYAEGDFLPTEVIDQLKNEEKNERI